MYYFGWCFCDTPRVLHSVLDYYAAPFNWNYLTLLSLQFHCCTSLTGVYLQWNGVFISNNSAVFISDIENADINRLQCITDRMPCCSSSQTGEWYFPDGGGAVPV